MNILFLALDSPWPAYSGATLRSFGLLKELSKQHRIEMVILTHSKLSSEQFTELDKYAQIIHVIPLKDTIIVEKLRAIFHSFIKQIPYHCAIIERSLQDFPEIQEKILGYTGLVFTSIGHWGIYIQKKHAKNWVLNQCDADVEFWRVYAMQATNFLVRMAAQLNYRLAKKTFPSIYAHAGRVISVCQEDKLLTENLSPTAKVEIIENGVDCAHLVPKLTKTENPSRLLFTGTSVARNMLALSRFVTNVLPLIRRTFPEQELLIAGNFSFKAQSKFKAYHRISFTGTVPDIRPYFNQSDVFISPFEETYGSKLKIAEAMAMGMPIVSTIQGVRGFQLVDGQSVCLARDDEEFASRVVELLQDVNMRQRLGKKARQVALKTLNWPILGQRLEKIIEDVAREIFLDV